MFFVKDCDYYQNFAEKKLSFYVNDLITQNNSFENIYVLETTIEPSFSNKRQIMLDLDGNFFYTKKCSLWITCETHMESDRKTSFVNEIFALSFTMQYNRQRSQMQTIERSQYLLKTRTLKCTQFLLCFTCAMPAL